MSQTLNFPNIFNEPESLPIRSVSRYVFWRLPDIESKHPNTVTLERLGKSIKAALRPYKKLPLVDKLLELDHEMRAENFLEIFFLSSFDTAIFVNLANLSLIDKIEKRIALSIRIPLHPIFNNGDLPDNIAITVVGYCPTANQSPIFIPEKVFLTHGQIEPTSYESQLEVNFRQLRENQYPERGLSNVLVSGFTKALPKYAVETKRRLDSWLDFLTFKENLIRHKTQGLRYLHWVFNDETGQVEFLVMAENDLALNLARKAFSRQNLHAFELSTSICPFRFLLRQNSAGDRIESTFGNFGQLASNGIKAIKKSDVDKDLMQACQADLPSLKAEDPKSLFEFEKAVFAYLFVEVSEDLNNRISQIEDDVIDSGGATRKKDSHTRLDKINALFMNIPKNGFLSISLLGDLSLVNRHRRAVNNLRQNEGCYAPYLSSYLFDIANANQPSEIPEVLEWENKSLNDKQKMAVQKMLAAPDICLIQGPPGTGKTTVIAEACLQFAKRGETVLLASQAHDALDNALSRLQDNPNLRAIRLAKKADRITEEGKEFTGDNVLNKQYRALRNYVVREHLKPRDDLETEIRELTEWLREARFVEHDLARLRENFRQNQKDAGEAKALFLEAQAQFDLQTVVYGRQQQDALATQQLITFLQGECDTNALSNLTLQLSDFVYPLVEKLCGLQTIKIKQSFTYSDFLADPENQLAILGNLFSRWEQIQQVVPKMQLDLKRLNESRDGRLTDTHTQLKIDALNQEIVVLEKQMDEKDDDQFSSQWKQKRKEIRSLRESQVNGLNIEHYKCFSDVDIFTRIEDIAEVKGVLNQRLQALDEQKKIIDTLTFQVIAQLQKVQSQITTRQPNQKAVNEAQDHVDRLSELQEQLRLQVQQKLNLAKNMQTQSGLDSSEKIEDTVVIQKTRLERLNNELAEINRQNQDFQPLFERWQAMLAEPEKRAKEDWNELKQPYIDSCNLVAISCNEDERTLTSEGFDGFDVVIIDEVSKATPLELLLPLMRGKKAILVGDHRQLPPVFNEADGLTFEEEVEQSEAQNDGEDKIKETELTKENLHKFEKMVTASLFKELFEQAPETLRERLNIQFRMHPDIMRLVNFFYEGQLECGNSEALRSHGLEFKTLNNHLLRKDDHVLWIDTTNDEKGKRFSINQNQGNTNVLEARLIANTLVEINRQLEVSGVHGKHNKLKVGVVSFYQPQCRIIREEIRKLNNPHLKFSAIDVEINTVIRYQGKEKPVILLSLVKNNGGELNQKHRAGRANIARFEFINVAMSRAQNLLLVFGARNMLENREVKLPRMDRSGHDIKMVYKQMFSYLEYQTEKGGLCEAVDFSQALLATSNRKK
jgi:hypothetical protein